MNRLIFDDHIDIRENGKTLAVFYGPTRHEDANNYMESHKPKDVTCRETEQKATADIAENLLVKGFAWDHSTEGKDYWYAIYKRLKQIGKDGILKKGA